MNKTICNVLFIKIKILNQRNAEKSEKEDQTDLKSLLLRFKVDPPLSGLMVDDFALLRLAAIDGLYRAEASA